MEQLQLPAWSVVSDRRRQHVERVVALLGRWAREAGVNAEEARAWIDAGRYHDALRDADEVTLRGILPRSELPKPLLHGPAAAALLRQEGEKRQDVLDAIAYHTIGWSRWGAPGRALYCADFLEPGREFDREKRAVLAARFPKEASAVLREVVRMRLLQSVESSVPLRPETVELWNSLTSSAA